MSVFGMPRRWGQYVPGPVLGGFLSRFKKGRSEPDWESTITDEVDRLVQARPPDVTVMIPALQVELGKRLELASRLMKERGYRLRQVVPESGMTWAASFMRMTD